MHKRQGKNGFTLIEMSIVLVIIGLLVGGVLVGRDLIAAAELRAQITQIEKFQQAVNTFKLKYNALPGDMDGGTATTYGFMPRATPQGGGGGDGNGVIETQCCGTTYGTNYSGGYFAVTGENTVFWSDLTYANGLNINLIEGNFNSVQPFQAGDPGSVGPNPAPSGSAIASFFPAAKIGSSSYVYVWSGGTLLVVGNGTGDGINYFGIAAIQSIGGASVRMRSSPSLAVIQAYRIDQKIDDGLPQSGNVTALYLDANTVYSQAVWVGSGGHSGAPYTSATPGSALTCFDKGYCSLHSLHRARPDAANCPSSTPKRSPPRWRGPRPPGL